MGLFDIQKVEDPVKWRAHYEFGGALLLGLTWELPGSLGIVMTASKSPGHPGLAGLSETARRAIPADALLTTVRISCTGVRGFGWIARPRALADLKDAIGAFGRVDKFEMNRLTMAEKSLWPDAPPPYEFEEEARDLWHGLMAGHDYAVQWFCDLASLREGA